MAAVNGSIFLLVKKSKLILIRVSDIGTLRRNVHIINEIRK